MAMLRICLFAFCFLSALVPETSGLKAKKGDDDGDGGGGMGGALAGLFGGAGGGGGEGAGDSDDDPNMVGGKKKSAPNSKTGGVDVAGLEDAMKSGGTGGLMSMLKAMRAAQGSSGGGAKIIKKKNGEEMYDFRDLDDGVTTTMMSVKIEQPTFSPLVQAAMAKANEVELPSMPTLGKNGMLSADAMKQIAASAAKAATYVPVPAATPAGKNLVVWPPASPVPQAIATPLVYQPLVPVAQISTGSAASAQGQGLYQGLAALRANMDALMNQAVGGGGVVASVAPSGAGEQALEAKIDQMSQNMVS